MIDVRSTGPPENPESIEMDLFLEAVFRGYGYDFREYSPASMLRRIRAAMTGEALSTISALQDRVLHDADCMERFLGAVTVNVTSMFRDPTFYVSFRKHVVPRLRTYPFVRVWVAGCSSGEEVYSLAILLEEEELYERTRIYATDLSPTVLERATDGIYPLSKMREYTSNYQRAGGQRAFSQYYDARYDSAIFRESLKGNLVFAEHNLAAEASFNEFNVILCRNVMIYFGKSLQARVFQMFHESLCPLGFLALGRKESLRWSPIADQYATVDGAERLFRRIQ